MDEKTTKERACPRCGGTDFFTTRIRMDQIDAEGFPANVTGYLSTTAFICRGCGHTELWTDTESSEFKRTVEREEKRAAEAQKEAELDAYWRQKLAEQKEEEQREEQAQEKKRWLSRWKDPWDL